MAGQSRAQKNHPERWFEYPKNIVGPQGLEPRTNGL